MKKSIFPILVVIVIGSFAATARAQMMGTRLPDGQGFSNSTADWEEIVEHTTREKQKRKKTFYKKQNKKKTVSKAEEELENPPIIGAFTFAANELITTAAKIVKISFFIFLV